jgi:hypothetical protein
MQPRQPRVSCGTPNHTGVTIAVLLDGSLSCLRFVPALALFVFTADSSELTVPLLSLSPFPILVTTMMTDTLLDDIKYSS